MNFVTTCIVCWFCILKACSSGNNNVCPANKTENRPVINMCNDDIITQSEHLFLDAFVPANDSTICYCILRATESVRIGTSTIIAPNAPCQSNVTLFTDPRLNFTCGYEQETPYRDIGTEGLQIELRTSASSKDTTYCLGIFIKTSSGNLSIHCFPPFLNSSTTTSSTTSSTTSLVSETTSSTSTNTSSASPSVTSTEQVSITSFSETTSSTSTNTASPMVTSTQQVSITSSTTSSSETTPVISSDLKQTTQRSSDPASFPVAAVAGGISGGVLFIIDVIIIVMCYRRKKKKASMDVWKPMPNSQTDVIQ